MASTNKISPQQLLSNDRDTLILESTALEGLIPRLTEDFEKAVRKIAETSGRVVRTGIGKSALIAQKIVATVNSTGTPALSMHAADAIPGDLGMRQEGGMRLLGA